MLPMGCDRRQGKGHVAQLTARSEHVPSFAFSYEDVEAPRVQHLLKPHDDLILRAPKLAAGKFVEGNEVDLAAQSLQQLREPLGILLGVVDTVEHDILEREAAMRGKRIGATSGQQSAQGMQAIDRRHQLIALGVCGGIQ